MEKKLEHKVASAGSEEGEYRNNTVMVCTCGKEFKDFTAYLTKETTYASDEMITHIEERNK